MGWSNSNTSSGGGGGSGTTINPTNNRVPVRQNGTTFVDAQIISNISSTPYILQLLDSNDNNSIDWENRIANDSNPLPFQKVSIDWANRTLNDSNGQNSLNYDVRSLISVNSSSALNFSCTRQKTTSDFYQNDFLVDTSIQSSILSAGNIGQILWWSGHTITGEIDSSVVAVGSLLALIGGTWFYADFSVENGNSTNILGIWVGGNEILLDGHIVAVESGVTTDFPIMFNMSALSNGRTLYGCVGTPKFDTQKPTLSGNVIRRLGHTYFTEISNAGYYLMLFRPSNDWSVV